MIGISIFVLSIVWGEQHDKNAYLVHLTILIFFVFILVMKVHYSKMVPSFVHHSPAIWERLFIHGLASKLPFN